MYKKVIKNKQSCHFAPQGGDHYNISREEKRFIQDTKDLHLLLNSSGRVWQGETRALVNWSGLSPLSAGVLDSVPEASGYFCKGGLSGCSNHLLFTLLMREGPCTLNYTQWQTRSTWHWTDGIESNLLYTCALNPKYWS